MSSNQRVYTSATVNLNVVLAAPAQSLTDRRTHIRLPGYVTVTPRHHPAPLPGTHGQIITHGDTITVRLDRRAYSPVLRKADIPATRIPWLGDRIIRYELA